MPKRTVPESAAAEMFGRSLRALREDRGLVAKDVAELLNLNTDTILKYERGEREPSLLTLIRLSHLFGVGMDRLVTGQTAKVSMIPFASRDSLQDIVVIRDKDGDVVYVGPDRRGGAKNAKYKGAERRQRKAAEKPGKIKRS